MSNQNTPNPDQRAHMVSDALSALSHNFRPVSMTEAELLLQRAKAIAFEVKKKVKPFIDHDTLIGGNQDVTTLAHVISKAFAEGFASWSKDELLYLITLMHTETAVSNLVGDTNVSKIIKPI